MNRVAKLILKSILAFSIILIGNYALRNKSKKQLFFIPSTLHENSTESTTFLKVSSHSQHSVPSLLSSESKNLKALKFSDSSTLFLEIKSIPQLKSLMKLSFNEKDKDSRGVKNEDDKESYLFATCYIQNAIHSTMFLNTLIPTMKGKPI